MNPRFARLRSTSRQKSSMRKWRNCTFLHSVRRSPSLLRNNQVVQVSRSKALSRVGTTVTEREGSSRGIYRHLEAAFPRYCAPRERPVQQRSGLAVTEEWRPGRRRATSLPEEEQATQRHELSGRRCHATATSGLHRSWWALASARSGNRLHSVQPCVDFTRPTWAPPQWLLASPTTRKRVCVATEYVCLRAPWKLHEGPEVRERCRNAQTRLRSQERSEFPRCPEVRERSRARPLAVRSLRRGADHGQLPAFGLYMSLRHPVPLGGWGV